MTKIDLHEAKQINKLLMTKKYLLLYYKTSPQVEVVVITLPLVPATWITFIFNMSSSRSSSCKQITKKPKQRKTKGAEQKKR